jgi:hypothetical protein
LTERGFWLFYYGSIRGGDAWMLGEKVTLKAGYKVAGCCCPEPSDPITGYHSHDNVVVVHGSSCENLNKVESKRLIQMNWAEILEKEEGSPGSDYHELDEVDFRMLLHHKTMGVDYSLMVAKILNIKPEEAFERHGKLRAAKLLRRVQKVVIRYRENVVDNKWIKHRNHTYYQITPKGEKYLDFFVSRKGKDP